MDRETTPTRVATEPVEHPELGASTAYLDNRRLTTRAFVLSFVWMGIGLFGTYMANGDIRGGDSLGYFFMLAGLILILYGMAEFRTAMVRFREPIRLVIAENGFAFADGPGVIAWGEVAVVDFETSTRQAEPLGIRLRIREPQDFIERRPDMKGSAKRSLIHNEGWMRVGTGYVAPLEDVLAAMKEHLVVTPPETAPVDAPAPEESAPSKRRPGRVARR